MTLASLVAHARGELVRAVTGHSGSTQAEVEAAIAEVEA